MGKRRRDPRLSLEILGLEKPNYPMIAGREK
jgi:hypothetical protein